MKISILIFTTLLTVSCNNMTDTDSDQLKIACIGDSITYGAGIFFRSRYSYPARIEQMSDSKWNVGNFGVNGATLIKNGDKSYWDQKALHKALSFQPDIVIIMLGTNDTRIENIHRLNGFIDDYQDLIDLFQKSESKPEVFICYPVPVFIGSGTVIEDEIIPRIQKVARLKNIPVIDLHSPFKNQSQYFPDNVHPNRDGARLIAENVFRFLTSQSVKVNKYLK